jgi:hypothetical protein
LWKFHLGESNPAKPDHGTIVGRRTAMDSSTRIGVGATALFTIVGFLLGAPIGWVSSFIIAVCGVAATWGLWPLVEHRVGNPLTSRIPLHVAARLAYERAEKAGILDLITLSSDTPDSKLNRFKMLLVTDDETEVFGIEPPSKRSRLISKSELQDEFGFGVYPVDGDVSQLDDVTGKRTRYVDVTIRRKDWKGVIDGCIAEARAHRS